MLLLDEKDSDLMIDQGVLITARIYWTKGG
jgi:hypothetical protein